MKNWITRAARILSIGVFFAVFFVGINPEDPFNTDNAIISLVKAAIAGVLFWIVGYILGDIIFKGVVETVGGEDVPVYEGGLVQRVRDEKEKLDPDVNALKPRPRPALAADKDSKSLTEVKSKAKP